ncbi:unnamed protein product [Nezara viridula]|uniref:NADH dehydrogenase [ubiquinone] 1 beta subcomplex subunit 6 n=1 Tax=Nezara viridula TaxID=85310 RepID=A0A9P0E5N8_NEZVI|nr:unnamed protein product [Nezara viridula]
MASPTGGVKPMSLEGRLYRERERLSGMTSEERAWRAKFLKDQILSPNEPRHVPEMYTELYNPIRRAYRKPLDAFGKLLEPVMGVTAAQYTRYFAGKFLMTVAVLYAGTYYLKYNANDWTRKGGWRVVANRPAVFPGNPGFPAAPERTHPSDYASRGFKNAPI